MMFDMQSIVDNPQIDMPWVQALDEEGGLAARIAAQVRRAIITGAMLPGQKINEDTFAEAFRTSRTPVREALRLLESEGLVTVFARRGAWVAQLSVDEVLDVYLCRAHLLGIACRLAAERASETDLDGLHAMLVDLRALAASDDWMRYAQQMSDINDRIVDISRCLAVRDSLRPLNGKADYFRYVSIVGLGRQPLSASNYERFVAAIRERRGEEAEAIMRGAVTDTGKAMAHQIAGDGARRAAQQPAQAFKAQV